MHETSKAIFHRLKDSRYATRYRLAQIPGLHRFDQTQTPVGECAIEFVLRKPGGGPQA